VKRYAHLDSLIDTVKPQHIVEIGTNAGARAFAMCKRALNHHAAIRYTGFDVFEHETPEFHEAVFNGKKPGNKQTVTHVLATLKNVEVDLVQGKTQDTLHGEMIVCDFAFVDGDHRAAEIEADFYSLSCPVIVLDDFYSPDENGICPDISKVGCNQLVSKLDPASYQILPSVDRVRGGGFVHFVTVRLK